MKISEMARLAAKNKKSIPNLIQMIAESLENTDNRLQAIENAIRDLASKVTNQGTQVAETVGQVTELKKSTSGISEELNILKVWTDNKTMASVSDVQQGDMVVMERATQELQKSNGMPSVDEQAQ